MKFCALLFVVAVCAVMLPSDVDARGVTHDMRAVVRRATLVNAKRQLAKRDDDDDDTYAEFFESDEVAELLARYDITMEELDEMIMNDDEIDPEDRDIIKLLSIMVLFGIGDISLEDSSEEIRAL